MQILPIPTYLNGLIVVKLKRDLKYKGYVYFDPLRLNFIYQALNFLKALNKFCEDISISRGLSSKEMINFSDIDKHEDVAESIHKKIISNETGYGSVEESLSMHRTGLNETAFVSEIPSIINDENVITAPGQRKKPVSVLSDESCKEEAFPYLFPKGKFGCKAPQDIPINPRQ